LESLGSVVCFFGQAVEMCPFSVFTTFIAGPPLHLATANARHTIIDFITLVAIGRALDWMFASATNRLLTPWSFAPF